MNEWSFLLERRIAMENLIYFGIVFILVSLVYLLFINKRRLKKESIKQMGEVSYIVGKFKLDQKKINLKSIVITIGFINAFIIGFVSMIVAMIPLQIIWQFMIGFALLFALVYSLYEIYGRILIHKGWGRTEKGKKDK